MPLPIEIKNQDPSTIHPDEVIMNSDDDENSKEESMPMAIPLLIPMKAEHSTLEQETLSGVHSSTQAPIISSMSTSNGESTQTPIISRTSKKRKSVLESHSQREDTSTPIAEGFIVSDYVVHKDDLKGNAAKASIWRLDSGKILEKYTPFNEKGVRYYKSTGIFRTWDGKRQDLYKSVEIRSKKCQLVKNRQITVIQLKTDLFQRKQT